jgi:hypothetical protein
MNIAHRNIMRIATVLLLTAASTSAFAQSAEYRRGYEAGYAAGQSARDDRGEHGGRNRLHIEEAEYGARGSMCDARQGVRDEIERNRGAVVAHNELCGDPAPGEQKRLRVIYRCGDSQPARAFVREGQTLRLRCR